MPNETQQAINWALSQTVKTEVSEESILPHMTNLVVEKVSEYFNINSIPYESFSYDDLISYLS